MLTKYSVLIFLAPCLIACSQQRANTIAVAHDDGAVQLLNSKNQSGQERALSPAITPTPDLEASFGKGLKIVPRVVKLENQRLRSEIDVTYPQIESKKQSAQISKLNRRIKRLVADQYNWLLNPPTKAALQHYEKFPGVLNSVNLYYEIFLVTNGLLSIYFNVYSYGIGAAHSVQHSFTINYDLRDQKLLKLADIFKPNARHLHFISRYCINQLAKDQEYLLSDSKFTEALAPSAKNFESWGITKNGVLFSFDACRLSGCAAGQQQVEIPISAIKRMISPKGPLMSL